MIKQLNYSDFVLISYIGELGNYTRISEKIYISQPAITLKVKHIESILNRPIVVKVGKKICLTENGELLRKHYLKFKLFYQELEDDLRNIDNDLSGVLTIGTSDTLGIHVLPDFILGFGKHYPNIQLNLTSKPSRVVAQDVLNGKIDIGIALSSSIDHRYQAYPIFERKDCIIVATNSKWTKYKSLTLSFFRNERLILLDKMSQSHHLIVDWFKKKATPVQITMELGSIEMVKRYVEMNLGFSIVPEISIQNELREKRLHKIDIIDSIDYQTVAAFTKKNMYIPQIARHFIEYLLAKSTLKCGNDE